ATNHMDQAIYVPAALVGGGLAFGSHGTKAALRLSANLSPEPFSNWILSLIEDFIAFAGTLLAVFAPFIIASILIIFVILFVWFFPKVVRAVLRMFKSVATFFRGESLQNAARKVG